MNIILLHGALGSSKTFDSFTQHLSNCFNIYSFDFLGHGALVGDETISANVLCEQLIEFVEANQLKPATIFGYSMGGYIALMACLKRPELFGKVITMATKFEWSNDIAKHEIKQLEMMSALSSDHPFKKQLELLHGASNVTKCVGAVINLMLDLGENKYLNNTTLPAINNPVLLLLGELDKMVSLEETISVLNNLKNSQLEILPDTKHPFEKVNFEELQNFIKHFAFHAN